MEFYNTFRTQFELLPRFTIIYGSDTLSGFAIEWLWFGVLLGIKRVVQIIDRHIKRVTDSEEYVIELSDEELKIVTAEELAEMEKLYFKTTGQEPDVTCIEPCIYKDRPSKGTMIGSSKCQACKACYGWDSEENWVKCLNYSLDVQGLCVRLA